MQPRTKAALFDVAQAAIGIAQFIEGKTLKDFKNDLMLRSAIERQLGIIGEAISRVRKDDPSTAARISEVDKIISYRNILIHGYDRIDDETSWKIVQDKLPILRREVESLLI
jgi:uncharacterized protein with HEPN domain